MKVIELDNILCVVKDEGPIVERNKFCLTLVFSHGDADVKTVERSFLDAGDVEQAMDMAMALWMHSTRDIDEVDSILAAASGSESLVPEHFIVPFDCTSSYNYYARLVSEPKLTWIDSNGFEHVLEFSLKDT